MSANLLQAIQINSGLCFSGSWDTALASYARVSEVPLVSDNLNKGMSFYTKIMGEWVGYTEGMHSGNQSEASRNGGSWWQPTGYEYNWGGRPWGSFFSRCVTFNDEVTRYGYISTAMGGFLATGLTHDQVNNGAVSYEPVYGHGVPASWPIPCTDQGKTQFRDPASLPSDGASRILLTGSAYNRSPYLHPVYYLAHIVSGGTVASGNVKFFIEQRPSWRMTQGLNTSSHHQGIYSASAWFPDVVNAQDKVLTAMAWVYGHVPGQILSRTYVGGAYVMPDSASALAVLPSLRDADPRVRQTATISLNDEYYCTIWGSLLTIYSNKCSRKPMFVYDFAQTLWAGSTFKRIAGVAPDGLNLWVLSESGDMALVDFSVSGGQVLSKASAPALTAGDRYGAIARIGTTVWALVGSHAENPAAPATSASVGLLAFDTAGNTWGVRSSSPLLARHNTRTLTELIALADGRLAALVEDVAVDPSSATDVAPLGANRTVGATNNAGWVAGRTLITKLPGSVCWSPGKLARIKLGFIPTYGKLRATIKWVPKGSPVGTTFVGSVQCLFSGLAEGTLSNNTAWNAATLTSDWITLDWDPSTYDYYVYAYLPTGSWSGNYYMPFYDDLTHYGYAGASSVWIAGDGQAATESVATPNPSLGAVWSVESTPTDNMVGTYNSKVATSSAAWQVLVFNPTGTVWNTTKVSTALFNTGSRVGLPSFEQLYNTPFFAEVGTNVLLVQANWRNTKTFVVNVGGTLDSSAVLDVSWGTGTTIYPTGANPSWPIMTFMKNVADGGVCLWTHSYTGSYDWAGYPSPVCTARPTFVWDGSEKMVIHGANGYGGGVTNTIAKDGLYAAAVDWNSAPEYGGYFREWALPVHYSSNQLTILNHSSGGANHVTSNRATQGIYYLPRYWKWFNSAWTPAKDWADAAANPYTVPTTPDTPIPVVHGLVFNFGPNTNTTFQAGEFHTVNVTYGQVKFARRTRWDFTMFAGRTFHHQEARAIATLGDLGHRYLPISVSTTTHTTAGPATVTNLPGWTHAYQWPVMSGTVPNDTPLVVTYDLTSVPTAAHVSGATVSMSTPVKDWTYSSSDEYWRADFGTGVTKILKAYAYSRYGYSDTRAFGKWLFQGSNDASDTPTNWTTLDTVTGFVWPTGANDQVPWVARSINNTTAYRHYRLLFQAETNAKMRLSNVLLYDQPLGDASFADLMFGRTTQEHVPFVYGLKFEVNTNAAPDTAGFIEITPKHRGHNGLFYCFDRQVGIKQLRVTCKQGAWYSDTVRQLPPLHLWDYASQAVMDSLRLGSSAAANNTKERGAHDTECLGIGTDSAAIWVDSNSPVQWTPANMDYLWGALGWFGYGGLPAAGKFQLHPYYGFIKLPANTPGTTLNISYAWGRRV